MDNCILCYRNFRSTAIINWQVYIEFNIASCCFCSSYFNNCFDIQGILKSLLPTIAIRLCQRRANTQSQIENPEDIGGLFGKLFEQIQTTTTQPELIDSAKKGKVTLTQADIQAITTEGQVTKETKVTVGATKVAVEQAEELAELILTTAGELTGSGTPEDPFKFIPFDGSDPITFEDVRIDQLLDALTALTSENESLSDFNAQLLLIIESLRGGTSSSELLNSLFSLIAELQAQLGRQQGGQFDEEEEDPFGDFFTFLGDLNANFINFVGGLFK